MENLILAGRGLGAGGCHPPRRVPRHPGRPPRPALPLDGGAAVDYRRSAGGDRGGIAGGAVISSPSPAVRERGFPEHSPPLPLTIWRWGGGGSILGSTGMEAGGAGRPARFFV